MDYPLQTSAQLSAHIKSLRKKKGLSQAELGQILGLGQARIADIERNPGAVSLEQILQVLHLLDARLNLTHIDGSAAADKSHGKGEW